MDITRSFKTTFFVVFPFNLIDPKTKVVTVWTVEKPPSPKAAALRPGPRPWRF